ncbi:hypothetical protein [Clostridium sp.]|uniref:hypothetical protein n=1 Tax=Clostridium sp. TaxID=1506 RepID=UPI0026341C0A|nr:hypothetical protein [Clostridium sp.]
MKKYKVFLSNDTFHADEYTKGKYENLGKECKDISHLINSDYVIQDPETAYGELHSIVNYSNEDYEKRLLTIFQTEVFNVEFTFPDGNDLTYELSHKQIQFINEFRKVSLDYDGDNITFKVLDIIYSINSELIKVILETV